MLVKTKPVSCFILYAAIIIASILQQNIFAQNDSGIKLNSKVDSGAVLQKQIFNPFLSFPLSNHFIPSINYNDEEVNLLSTNQDDAWGISMARLRESTFFINDFSDNPNANLYMSNFLFKEKGFMTDFRYVLGLAGTSAAAYFAYKHIQKFGFIKDKK